MGNCSVLDWDYNHYNRVWSVSKFEHPYTSIQAKRDKNWCEPATATIYAPALPGSGAAQLGPANPFMPVYGQPLISTTRAETRAVRKYM